MIKYDIVLNSLILCLNGWNKGELKNGIKGEEIMFYC